jgi:glycosyltransferase involved in cell wall biosynthesis
VEGLATGLPAIWADLPATREATAGIGLPVPVGDVDAMRNAMKRLIDDATLRRNLGTAGRSYAETHRSWERVWRRYETELASVVR